MITCMPQQDLRYLPKTTRGRHRVVGSPGGPKFPDCGGKPAHAGGPDHGQVQQEAGHDREDHPSELVRISIGERSCPLVGLHQSRELDAHVDNRPLRARGQRRIGPPWYYPPAPTPAPARPVPICAGPDCSPRPGTEAYLGATRGTPRHTAHPPRPATCSSTSPSPSTVTTEAAGKAGLSGRRLAAASMPSRSIIFTETPSWPYGGTWRAFPGAQAAAASGNPTFSEAADLRFRSVPLILGRIVPRHCHSTQQQPELSDSPEPWTPLAVGFAPVWIK